MSHLLKFIPWVLGRCATVEEAKALLSRINLADIPFSRELPPAALHWIISDREKSIVVESVKTGIKIHRNPLGVMTNNPPFEYQMFNLNNYRGLCRETVENRFSDDLELDIYCQGLGGLGLPGDVSSMSRFVRAAFNSRNSVCREDENSSVSRFFHIMGSVEMIEGCCRTDAGTWDKTVYTSCVNTDRGLYYYTTYGNRQINCVNMYGENLDGGGLSVFDLNESENILVPKLGKINSRRYFCGCFSYIKIIDAKSVASKKESAEASFSRAENSFVQGLQRV